MASSLNHHILSFTLIILFSLLTSTTLADIPACNAADQAVLLQIKSHIKSPNPGIGDLSDWDPNTNCCDWDFIGCNDPGRVTAVTISRGSGLVGQIPEAIGNLPFLQEIMFEDEPKLTGPIPKSLSKLKNLEIIYLSSNGLTGPVPVFLGRMKKLNQIDISNNHFSGTIPASLSNLPALTSFNVSHNMLTGSIPSLQTKSLTSVDFSSNQLCGPIPTGLKKFPASGFGHNKCLCGAPLPACKVRSI